MDRLQLTMEEEIFHRLSELESGMGCSFDEDIEFSPSSTGVCVVIMAVEAVASMVSVGVYAIISHSDGLKGGEIVLGTMAMLGFAMITGILMYYCARRRRKRIVLQETLVYLKTQSGLEEIIFIEEIEGVKKTGENIFIKLKDDRIVALLPEDFKNGDKRLLFLLELGKRVARIAGEGDAGRGSGKNAA